MMPLLWVVGAVRIELGEPRRARRRPRGPRRPFSSTRQRTATVRPSVEVRQDAQAGAAAGDARDAVGERLAQRVDEVRAHRVAAVDVEVRDEHAAVRAGRAREDADVEADRAAAALGEAGHEAPGVVEDAGGGGAQGGGAGVDVVDLDDLDLADHHRRATRAT